MVWNPIREKKSEVKDMATGSKIVEMHPSGKTLSDIPAGENMKSSFSRRGEKDLAVGMEILDLDFLLSIVENTEGNEKNDVAMRKLTFDELLRREQQDTVDSNALKVYAMNEGDLYGKIIQCEAMKVLTDRTLRKSKRDS
jgi:hypothetical protein